MSKYLTNTNQLKGLIVGAGKTQSEVANFLGLSIGGFSKKLHNQVEFKQSEIAELKEYLKIDDISQIFFTKQCEYKSHNVGG